MAREIIKKGMERGWLLEPEAKELCKAYGLPVGVWKTIKTADEARTVGREIGYPLVMKIVSPDIIHKSDVGGVILNIKDGKEAAEAFRRIEGIRERTGCRLEGALVEKMAKQGTETIIGAKRDPQFGPVILFGLGGIFVEIFKDVSFRVAPITKEDAMEMIMELKAYPILRGTRGRSPSDVEAVSASLLKVSSMVMDLPEIKELDLNPTIVYEKGCRIVDARIIMK